MCKYLFLIMIDYDGIIWVLQVYLLGSTKHNKYETCTGQNIFFRKYIYEIGSETLKWDQIGKKYFVHWWYKNVKINNIAFLSFTWKGLCDKIFFFSKYTTRVLFKVCV